MLVVVPTQTPDNTGDERVVQRPAADGAGVAQRALGNLMYRKATMARAVSHDRRPGPAYRTGRAVYGRPVDNAPVIVVKGWRMPLAMTVGIAFTAPVSALPARPAS